MQCTKYSCEKAPSSEGCCAYDKENGVVRYSFIQCPNAEFARRHRMEDVLPVIHAALIREGTCVTADCCDYSIVGDKNPIAAYELVKAENGLLLSVRKESR